MGLPFTGAGNEFAGNKKLPRQIKPEMREGLNAFDGRRRRTETGNVLNVF